MVYLKKLFWIALFGCLACSRYNSSPSETDPEKLSDETILYRLCVKDNQTAVEWRRVSINGLNAMTFNQDRRTASYTSDSAAGAHVFTNLTFDLVRNAGSKKVTVRFFQNGLEKASEQITSLSVDTLKNEVDNHVYVRQSP